MDNNDIKAYLKNTLSEKRYVHSVNAAETAEKLASFYGIDSKKAYIAALVHDCTREASMEAQKYMLETLGRQVDELTYNIKELIHAHTAEYVMMREFEITDNEIILAVRYHTTGKENMTDLEKVVFLSDVLEPSRSFPGLENIRALAMVNLDQALLAALDSSIRFLVGKQSLIHPDTFYARNYVLKYFKE